jgi:hypothetical protein
MPARVADLPFPYGLTEAALPLEQTSASSNETFEARPDIENVSVNATGVDTRWARVQECLPSGSPRAARSDGGALRNDCHVRCSAEISAGVEERHRFYPVGAQRSVWQHLGQFPFRRPML